MQDNNQGGWHCYQVLADPDRPILEQISDKVIKKMQLDGLISKGQAKKWMQNKD